MDWLSNFTDPFFLWMVAGIVLIFLEFSFPGFIVVFFGIGAILTAVITQLLSGFVTVSFTAQMIMFTVFSVLSLIFLRKYAKRMFYGDQKSGGLNDFNEDDFTGKIVKVAKDIKPGVTGKVEFQGSTWNASSKERIKAGEYAEIISHDNLTLKVKRCVEE
ncbi:NfeD family protein [Sedimentisphaera salicampi]|uniref:NfeD-like C-terminal domain-containing protein n=1 Tax=Sedimentisphaera salicampi TaxID=1941349 RepID=A0A1W6LJS9_9BACT|nr:NfeD family protein [Sedimentisphaera salicampi]ARN56006.1 hypothetical protein STSP1_00376 [Sedimentisphaera salicampi]